MARAAARRCESPAWSSSTTRSASPRPSIGILGGTFDPIHNRHLEAARKLLEVADLDLVWLMPNAQLLHRQDTLAGPVARMATVVLVVTAPPLLIASRPV